MKITNGPEMCEGALRYAQALLTLTNAELRLIADGLMRYESDHPAILDIQDMLMEIRQFQKTKEVEFTMNEQLTAFLVNHGDDLLSWRGGAVVIETYYKKQFLALGGNIDRLIALFEDYGTMQEAAEHYSKQN